MIISYRTCVVTREKFEKHKMVKITLSNGRWYFDEMQKIDGRSIYIKNDKNAIVIFLKMKKRFKIQNDDFEKIKSHLGELVE